MREQFQILIHIIAEHCFFLREGMAVHLAGEHVAYLFLSGPAEGLLDGKTAEQTSCCNYTSKSCRKSFDNDANYPSYEFSPQPDGTPYEYGEGTERG